MSKRPSRPVTTASPIGGAKPSLARATSPNRTARGESYALGAWATPARPKGGGLTRPGNG